MGKSRSGSRVGQVIGGDVNGLHRGNGTALGGGDALLHGTHFGSQRGLVTHRRGHPSQQGRHLGTCLRKAENVVDKEKDVAALAFAATIAKVLGYRQSRQGHAGAGSGRFIHLAEHEGGLRIFQLVVIDRAEIPTAFFHAMLEFITILDNAGFDHFAHQVVALAGTFPHTRKHR